MLKVIPCNLSCLYSYKINFTHSSCSQRHFPELTIILCDICHFRIPLMFIIMFYKYYNYELIIVYIFYYIIIYNTMFYKNILSEVGVNRSPLNLYVIQREQFSISKSNCSPQAHILVTQLHPKGTGTHPSNSISLERLSNQYTPIYYTHPYTTKIKYALLRMMLARKKQVKLH